MRNTIITALLLVFVFVSVSVSASIEDSTRVAPIHVSFITPFGTNGFESWNTVNNLSINLFAGYSGGLNGIEVAGFANALRGDMKGIQIAGFCNNTFGQADGAEIAGYWNYNHKDVRGFQASGFANVAIGHVEGFQASGFANYAHGVTFGQVSGFANLSTGDVSGVQASGFANLTTGDQSGIQASGFANMVTGKLKGVQASGFFNYAKTLKGVQIGFINYADSIESGIPVGFLSFVRKGYLAIDLGGNESLYGTISLKTGVRRFYNIISLGGAVHRGDLYWGWGYGFGTLLPVAKRIDIAIEGQSWHLNENWWFTGHLNSLNRLQVTAAYQITPMLSAYLGPSLNVWVTETDDSGDPYSQPPVDGWSFYHNSGHWSQVDLYAGLSAGIRIQINQN